jgi:hypothetical protein
MPSPRSPSSARRSLERSDFAILIYRKGKKDDLTSREKAVLRKINAEW